MKECPRARIDFAGWDDYKSDMPLVGHLGAWVWRLLAQFGEFCAFCGATLAWLVPALRHRRQWREVGVQVFDIGTRSVPVIMVTGAFVGAVLAVQTVPQFKGIGLIDRMGTVVNLSVLRELGPVLAGVMLAGRVGGGLTAELGTMRVTEQIDALRAMGADPIRVLVVPRFLACVVLIPILAMYASFMGILGGYVVSVYLYGANPAQFLVSASDAVLFYDVLYGPIKCFFFGGAISLIACYKGFSARAGAAGVGRACTESFVASCLAIISLDFFLGVTLNRIIEMLWEPKSMLG